MFEIGLEDFLFDGGGNESDGFDGLSLELSVGLASVSVEDLEEERHDFVEVGNEVLFACFCSGSYNTHGILLDYGDGVGNEGD